MSSGWMQLRERERESWPLARQEKNKRIYPGPVHFLTEGRGRKEERCV